jgi:hypothetical protein
LVVSLVLGALSADTAKGGEDRELKILARGVWPVRKDKPVQLVLRSAEELAVAHEIDPKDAKDKRMQSAVSEDVAKLLKVKAIDWKKQMIVVVTAGTKPTAGYSIEVLTLAVKDKTLTVRWKLNSPKPDAVVASVITHPSQMALVERFEGPVQFDPPAKN